MKLPSLISIALFFFSCQQPCPETNNVDLDAMQVKLDATEAQLLNVSAELSKCKGQVVDTSNVVAE